MILKQIHVVRALSCGVLFLLCPLAAFAEDNQQQWQFNADLSLSSDYIYRGISLADGEASPQLKAWLGHQSGWFSALWLAKADIGGIVGESLSRDWEAEYSLGYRHLLNADWQVTVSNAWLEYRQDHLPRNADYQERRVQFDFQDNLSLSAAYTDSVWNTGHSQWVVAATARGHLPWRSVGEVEIGLVDLELLDGDQYHYGRISVGRPFGKNWVGVLEYHYSGNIDDVFNSSRTGSQFSVGVSYHFGL